MRAQPATSLQEIAAQHGLQGTSYNAVSQAFEAAKAQAKPDDLIYIGGSTFVVAEAV